MKKVLVIISAAIIAFSSESKAQTYSITPNDTLVVTAPYFTITIFDIFQDNISGAPLNLAWTLVSNNLVPGWDFSLCDYTTCYTGLPASGTMTTVPDSGQGFLGLNVDPVNISGTGTVRIYVYDVTNPNGGDTLTWIVSTPPVGIETPADLAFLQIYPNPAIDVLHIQPGGSYGITSAMVVDVTGRQVVQGVMSANGVYTLQVAALPDGIYFVACELENGVAIRRQFIKTSN